MQFADHTITLVDLPLRFDQGAMGLMQNRSPLVQQHVALHLFRFRLSPDIHYRSLRMNLDDLRAFCLSMPGATEQVQWEHDLLFKVGGKAFVFAGFDKDTGIAVKCEAAEFAELCEREGIKPSAYIGRFHWAAIERLSLMTDRELKQRIRTSYDLVVAKLPKRERDNLVVKTAAPVSPARSAKRTGTRK